MFDFRRKLKQGTARERFEVYNTHYNLARASLEVFGADDNETCRPLYCCLSHLALIPELDINLAAYDDLMFKAVADCESDVVDFARQKISELEELLQCA